jgi:hypothetical protein
MKEIIYAINVNSVEIKEVHEKVILLSGLLHNYIESKDDVDNLKKYLDEKKVKQEKQQKSKKETKHAS